MLSVLLTIFLVFFLSCAYSIIKAYRFKQFYAKHAKELGYKVHEHPYCWLGSAMYNQFKRQYQANNDSNYHYKNHLSSKDLIVSNLIFRTMVEIQNTLLIKQFFLKANEGYYVKGDYGLGHLQRLIGTENLLLSEGDFWKNRRKHLSKVFNYDFIVSQIPKIQKICRKTLSDLIEQSGNSEQIKCDITVPLLDVFSGIILQCFFKGNQISHIGDKSTVQFINDLLLKITEQGRSKAGVFFGVKFLKLGLTTQARTVNQDIMRFRNVAKQIVERRLKQIKSTKYQGDQQKVHSNDIIEALLRSKQIQVWDSNQNKDDKNVQKISIDSLINQFLTFYIAGTQTTLAFTRMMIYRLSWHPQVLQKVIEQFEREAPQGQITIQQLKNLKYFEKVQKQVLRMDSSVGAVFTRVATKDHYLGNLKIYKGMTVNIRMRALHFKESIYHSPNQFKPQRWNNQNAQNDNYTYLPFSAGGRNCIGKHLSLLENKVFMIEFLRRFKKIVVDKKQNEVRFLISTLYGPEKLTTKLCKK